jgi:hypothetical protein
MRQDKHREGRPCESIFPGVQSPLLAGPFMVLGNGAAQVLHGEPLPAKSCPQEGRYASDGSAAMGFALARQLRTGA